MNFLDFTGFNGLLNRFRRTNEIYPFNLSLLSPSTSRLNRTKLAMVMTNPAALKVITLQCDLFSLGRIKVIDADGNEIENDPFLTFIGKPNPFQGRAQFLWDFMFWQMIGNSYCYVDSSVIDKKGNKMYFLDPAKIKWPSELRDQSDHLIFDDRTIRDLSKKPLKYRYNDGSSFSFSLDKIIYSPDLTNGLGNWCSGPSRLDALAKVISNSEYAIDSKNINVRFTSKFLVGSNNDVSKLGLGEEEKQDIENTADNMQQRIHAVKTQVQIRRFVENLDNLGLDKAFQADYFTIGSMYGIPRDVLETYLQSSTYENQEKARAAHIAYCMDPKGNQFMDSFENYFGYPAQKKNIVITWDHLPFMHVFEKEKADVAKVKTDTLTLLLKNGVPIEEINKFLGTNFTIDEGLRVQQSGQGQAQGG